MVMESNLNSENQIPYQQIQVPYELQIPYELWLNYRDNKICPNNKPILSLYDVRCRCNDKFILTKPLKSGGRSEGNPLPYPLELEKKYSKTFHIKYQKPLTIKAKFVLNSFRNKYIFYAIDDIIDNFKFNPVEKENLLSLLYSCMLFLHNNLYINFFDIWIEAVYINEKRENNRFLTIKNKNSKILTNISVKLFYRTRSPFKKPDSLW